MIKKILLADSGSTKTDWSLVNMNGSRNDIETVGLNPDFHSPESIHNEISRIKLDLIEHPDQIFFYGSGLSSENRKGPIREAMNEVFPESEIHIEHDLLGAARALHFDQKGIAAILGTGSNCSSYDGEVITKEYKSGGYIMSDEGGGVNLGRRVLKAFIEEYLEDDLRASFVDEFNLDVDGILFNIYKKPLPNRFIASFSKFAKANEAHPQINKMIEDNFRDFFRNKVCRFEGYNELQLGVVGSMAVHFKDQLRKVAADFDTNLGKLLERPIDGMVEYHQLKLRGEI